VDAQKLTWLTDPTIAPAPALDVLEAISASDEVLLLLAAEGQSELAPEVMRVSYDDGAEGIEIDAQLGDVRRALSDMQQVDRLCMLQLPR